MILDEDLAYKNGRSSKNSDLKSLIYIAAEKGYNDIVKLLCEPYEAGNKLDRKGQTSLKAAIIGRDISMQSAPTILHMCLINSFRDALFF